MATEGLTPGNRKKYSFLSNFSFLKISTGGFEMQPLERVVIFWFR
jgi:hypothetical protein